MCRRSRGPHLRLASHARLITLLDSRLSTSATRNRTSRLIVPEPEWQEPYAVLATASTDPWKGCWATGIPTPHPVYSIFLAAALSAIVQLAASRRFRVPVRAANALQIPLVNPRFGSGARFERRTPGPDRRRPLRWTLPAAGMEKRCLFFMLVFHCMGPDGRIRSSGSPAQLAILWKTVSRATDRAAWPRGRHFAPTVNRADWISVRSNYGHSVG